MIDPGSADKAVDDAIAKVDQSIPALKRLASSKKQKSSGRKAREAFQHMRGDPLLNEGGDDICLCARDARGECSCREKNSA